jgi:hypothetical protein
MKTITRALAGSVAAAAMAASAVTPAIARDGHGGGIGAGEIIAGALVLGGIAAVASATSNNDRDYGYNRAGYDNDRGDWRGDRGHGYGGRGNSRGAVERCVRAAEQAAGRHSYGRADVTDVRDIRETRYGFEVRGRIAVNAMGRSWRQGDNRYGRGWGGDYRGWNDNMRGYDSGSFKCKVERGRIVDLDFSGIRGL